MQAAVVVLLLALAVFSITITRGRLAATYYIMTNLIGAGLGPAAAAALAQYVVHDPSQVGLSAATLALIDGPLRALLLTLALAPYRRIVTSGAADRGMPR